MPQRHHVLARLPGLMLLTMSMCLVMCAVML